MVNSRSAEGTAKQNARSPARRHRRHRVLHAMLHAFRVSQDAFRRQRNLAEQQRAEAIMIADAQAAAASRRVHELSSALSTLEATVAQLQERLRARDIEVETIQRNMRESIELREQQLDNLLMENRNIRALHDNDVAELVLSRASLRNHHLLEQRLRREHQELTDQFGLLRAQETNAVQHRDQLREELARLVAVCEVLLQESPATWGPAHLALRDHLAHLLRPPAHG